MWRWIAAMAAGLGLVLGGQGLAAPRGGALATMTAEQQDAIAARMGPMKAKRFRVLVLAGTYGFHHESVSDAMTAIAVMGKESGLYDAELRTDFDLVNASGGDKMRFGFIPAGLNDFDAVVLVSTTGDWPLTDDQKQALLDFVGKQGRGLVAIHGALDANKAWPAYADLLGAKFGGHPMNTIEHPIVAFPLVNEAPDSPITRHLPALFTQQNELYVPRELDRHKVDVLISVDSSRIDTHLARTRDIPIAWTKAYGQGRVFYSSIGHTRESWDDPEVRRMYLEAIRWSLGLTNRPAPAGGH